MEQVRKFADLVYMDVWGPASIRPVHHCRYVLTILDAATRWLEMPLMTKKSQALVKFTGLEKQLATQYGVTVKQIQTDNGGEFTSDDFKDHNTRAGIVH